MFDSAKYNPLSIFIMMPSCVPATDMETAGAYLRWYDIAPQLHDDWVLGLGEMMNYRGVVELDEEVLNKLRGFASAISDGHAPGVSGRELMAYAAAGIGSDHESTTVAEMEERLRLGMYVFIREASNARNLATLIKGLTGGNSRRVCPAPTIVSRQTFLLRGISIFSSGNASPEGWIPSRPSRWPP